MRLSLQANSHLFLWPCICRLDEVEVVVQPSSGGGGGGLRTANALADLHAKAGPKAEEPKAPPTQYRAGTWVSPTDSTPAMHLPGNGGLPAHLCILCLPDRRWTAYFCKLAREFEADRVCEWLYGVPWRLILFASIM